MVMRRGKGKAAETGADGVARRGAAGPDSDDSTGSSY
jgi:hypothetical protein